MGRPRVARLDQERIAAAALELVDRDGDFTMPDLARRLKVQVSSIYHHAPGRAAVVELVRQKVTGQIDGSAFDHLPWDEALEVWARSFLAAFSRHPTAVRLLATEPVREPSIVDVYRSAAAGLRNAGFPDHQVMGVITAAENFLIGAALDAAAPDVMVEAGESEGDDALACALTAAPRGHHRAEQAFELGLQALLVGFRALLREAEAEDS